MKHFLQFASRGVKHVSSSCIHRVTTFLSSYYDKASNISGKNPHHAHIGDNHQWYSNFHESYSFKYFKELSGPDFASPVIQQLNHPNTSYEDELRGDHINRNANGSVELSTHVSLVPTCGFDTCRAALRPTFLTRQQHHHHHHHHVSHVNADLLGHHTPGNNQKNLPRSHRKLIKKHNGNNATPHGYGHHELPLTGEVAASEAAVTHRAVGLREMLAMLVPEYPLLVLALSGIIVSTGAFLAFPDALGRVVDLLTIVDGIENSVSVAAEALNNDSGDGGGGVGNIQSSNNYSHHISTSSELKELGWKMLAIVSVGAAAVFVHSSTMETLGAKIGAKMRVQLFQHILNQDPNFFKQNKPGELVNRLSIDVHETAEHLVENVGALTESIVKSASAALAMVMISPLLSFYSTAVVPAVIAGALFFGVYIKKMSRLHLDALAKATAMCSERFGAIITVLSFGRKDAEAKKYSRMIDVSFNYGKRLALWHGAFLGCSFLVGSVALLTVIGIGGNMVQAGLFTAGQLTSFCMYASVLAASMGEVTESASGILRAQGSASRLFGILDTQPRPCLGHRILPPSYKGDIDFHQVSFAYPDAWNIPVLDELSLSVKAGEMVAITGRSGCGKSSTVNLLLRLYEADRGHITLDGVDIRELDLTWLRSQIGYVEQDPVIFSGRIYDNIAYGKSDATYDEVVEASKLACAHEFIMELSEGYDTIVGERGKSLSGGQRQRISVARALLRKPRILLLDECTSALDQRSEEAILKALKNLNHDAKVTTFLVAHHMNSLAVCERVLVLDHGRLTQDGPLETIKF